MGWKTYLTSVALTFAGGAAANLGYLAENYGARLDIRSESEEVSANGENQSREPKFEEWARSKIIMYAENIKWGGLGAGGLGALLVLVNRGSRKKPLETRVDLD